MGKRTGTPPTVGWIPPAREISVNGETLYFSDELCERIASTDLRCFKTGRTVLCNHRKFDLKQKNDENAGKFIKAPKFMGRNK